VSPLTITSTRMSLPYCDCSPGVTNITSKLGASAIASMTTTGLSDGCSARARRTASTTWAFSRACRALMPKPGGGSVCEGGAIDSGTSASCWAWAGAVGARSATRTATVATSGRRHVLGREQRGIHCPYRPVSRIA
jgi:hypothetical protein